MAQDVVDQTLEMAGDRPPPPESSAAAAASGGDAGPAPALSRTGSSSRLNARAPEFVPAGIADAHQPRLVPIHHAHGPPPPPPAVIHVFAPPSPPFFAPPPPPAPGGFEYYGGGNGGGFAEHEAVQGPADPDPAPPTREGLPEEVVQKITKQVEYYFSDINLATTEHLMRFISKDPDGFVPISVIAAFKKIRALVHNNSELAMALRRSSKLVVSDDGKKVRRQHPFTESDMEELQSRIVVAENLPEDHCYQNLMKVFSAVGSVKTIRTCYPQTPNGTAVATNRSAKLDMLFCNKLHAFVEYETVEDADKAVVELNDEKNWRNGLRVRLLPKCLTKHGPGRGRRGQDGEGNGEEDVSISNQANEKLIDDPSQFSEASHEHLGEESFNDNGGRRGKGRGRGGRGRGRGMYHNNNNRSGSGHPVGTPPSSHLIHSEQPVVASKQPPGPRMPDGTRGFSMGRGKPLHPTSMT